MIKKIENDSLSIAVSTEGAELHSIWHKQQKQEYLWQAAKDWWPRHAPVLFPVVGKLQGNAFKYDGKTYTLPQHGFARDMEFDLLPGSGNEAEFVLRSNAETLLKYPFPFELKIRYTLEESTLHINYSVKNTGNAEMYFSIGAHPGFALHEGEKLNDYFIEFEKTETLDRHLLEDGCFNGKTERVITNDRILKLNDELMTKDAIVFKDMKSSFLTLKSSKSSYALKFEANGFPYYGIWSKPGASFVCLEPWCGMADNKGFSGDLKEKEGIRSLEVGTVFTRTFSVTL